MEQLSDYKDMKLWRLDFAHIICKDSILSLGGKDECSTLIGCFGYLIKKHDEYILVDCGIESLPIANKTKSSKDDWSRTETEGDMLWNLKRLGVSPSQISKVFLTHSHYDHMSGITHFENAEIYMSEKEYQYLHSENHAHKQYLTDAIVFIEQKKSNRALFLIKNTYQKEEICCQVVGGHTPGSMLVYIGEYLFTGDVVFLLENVSKEIPIGFSANAVEAKNAVSICKEHSGVVLTGHDLQCPAMII